MVGVVSSIPSGGIFIFADFETSWCQFCTKMPEMSDLYYLGKLDCVGNYWKLSQMSSSSRVWMFSDGETIVEWQIW